MSECASSAGGRVVSHLLSSAGHCFEWEVWYPERCMESSAFCTLRENDVPVIADEQQLYAVMFLLLNEVRVAILLLS